MEGKERRVAEDADQPIGIPRDDTGGIGLFRKSPVL
jgi:hypothetical protein